MKLMREKRIFLTVLVVILLAIYLVPVLWMVSSSFKTEKDIVALKWFPSNMSIENYTITMERAQMGRWFFNSIVVAVFSTAGIVFVSLFASYSLGRLEFPGKRFLFLLTLSGFMIPLHAIMIPLFLLLKSMKQVNAYGGLILPMIASPIAVLILTQFFKGIDREYEEAARLDGASEFQILFHVMVPMAIPAIITVAIFSFAISWNDFVWPLIIAQTDKMYTLPVGLATLADSDVNIRYGPVMAASVMASIPLFTIYVIFQRYIVQGVTIGELK